MEYDNPYQSPAPHETQGTSSRIASSHLRLTSVALLLEAWLPLTLLMYAVCDATSLTSSDTVDKVLKVIIVLSSLLMPIGLVFAIMGYRRNVTQFSVLLILLGAIGSIGCYFSLPWLVDFVSGGITK